MSAGTLAITWDANGKKARGCITFATQGLYCPFGPNCHKHHPANWSAIPTAAQEDIKKYVSDSAYFGFAEGQGPSE